MFSGPLSIHQHLFPVTQYLCLVKLAVNIHHVIVNCQKGFLGWRSEVKVIIIMYNCVTAIMAEAHILMVWHQGLQFV